MRRTDIPMIGICRQCAQLTDECTCPAREVRQRLIEQAQADEARKSRRDRDEQSAERGQGR